MSAWQAVLVVCCILAPLSWACLWIALRPNRRLGAVPDETEAPLMWPLSDGDDGSAEPYLRGGSHAASLSGRR